LNHQECIAASPTKLFFTEGKVQKANVPTDLLSSN